MALERLCDQLEAQVQVNAPSTSIPFLSLPSPHNRREFARVATNPIINIRVCGVLANGTNLRGDAYSTGDIFKGRL